MKHGLTDKPSVPTLIRAAAIGTLAWSPLACGDDESGDTNNTTDQFPTDPCSHGNPPPPECNPTSGADASATLTMTDSDTADPSTGFDSFPTTPCAHDPSSCESTGLDTLPTTTTVTATDTDTDTDGSSTGTGGTTTTG